MQATCIKSELVNELQHTTASTAQSGGMYPHVYETNYHNVLGQPQTQVGFQKKSLTSSRKTKSPE